MGLQVAIPYLLSLLSTQGARTVVSKVAGSATTRRKIANILEKNFKQATSKGKIPTEKTLTKNLTQDQKGLLFNSLPKTPTRGSPTFNPNTPKPNPTFNSPIPSQSERAVVKGILSQDARATGAAKARASGTVQQNISRASAKTSLQRQKAEAIKARQEAYGQNPITQTKDAGVFGRVGGSGGNARTMSVPGGLLTGAGLGYTAYDMAVPDAMNNGIPQQIEPPSDNSNVGIRNPEKNVDPRLLQVLFPNIGSKATNKELINAAILRASLEMLKPRATNENFASSAQRAITAGATVGSQNVGIYPSARAAREAGQAEGFSEIEVYQKDTGWSYKGTFDGTFGDGKNTNLPMVETAEDLAELSPGDSYKFVDENGVTRAAKVPLEGE